ncbi:hypothetical protein [Aeromicrobium sp.]|uniref:hypothetical protein n=1 Tax=Aeromicrobium sp. TaxID=1871063 RepID=UPI0019A16BBC|nr:hypothetical protein [Aeromicrobium sp.]MBC7630569.1 hypothetical protein [Aeromicrobium sp.]
MSGSESSRVTTALRTWTARQWWASAVASLFVLAAIGVPTDLIDTPLFSRSIAAPWWAVPVWVLTALLTGVLIGTYIDQGPAPIDGRGGVGALLGFLAVGCPVCNKLVLVALGTTGAVSVFQPLQPILAAASVALLIWAVQRRLSSAVLCTTNKRAS